MAETGGNKENDKLSAQSPIQKSTPGTERTKKKKTKANDGDTPQSEQKDPAAERETKAKMETKIRERVASEAQAFDVVYRLIESAVSVDYLQEACQYIDHNHYQDIVEERAISRLCGYPLCGQQLGQMTKKKYHISTKTNTVYDITERKNFCSNPCYRASRHLLQQIPQTPVWTRREEARFVIDLIQHHTGRSMEGEEVIGSSLFPLKQEILLLEKMERHTITNANQNLNSNNNAMSVETGGEEVSVKPRVHTRDGDRNMAASHANKERQKRAGEKEKESNTRVVDRNMVEAGVKPQIKTRDGDDGMAPSSADKEREKRVGQKENEGQTRDGDRNTALSPDNKVRAGQNEKGGKTSSVDDSSSVSSANRTRLKRAEKENGSVQQAEDRNRSAGDSLSHSLASLSLDKENVSSGGVDVENRPQRNEGFQRSSENAHANESSSGRSNESEKVRCDSGDICTEKQTHAAREVQSVSEAGVHSNADAMTVDSDDDDNGANNSKMVVNAKSHVVDSDDDDDNGANSSKLSFKQKSQGIVDSDDDDHDDESEYMATDIVDVKEDADVDKTDLGESKESCDHLQTKHKTHEGTDKPLQSVPDASVTADKAAYLMSLLDRRKHLLAKVADVQSSSSSNTTNISSSPASKVKVEQPGHSSSSSSRDNADVKMEDQSSLLSCSGADDKERSASEMDAVVSTTSANPNERNDGEKKSAETSNAERKGKSVQPKSQKSRPKELPPTATANNATESAVQPLVAACQFFSQWVTSDTLTFLDTRQGEGEGQSSFHNDPEMEAKYRALCQRITMQEKDFDELLGVEEVGEGERAGPTQPLPHFDDLKRDSSEYQLRVAHFLRGSSAAAETKDKQDDNDEGKTEENERLITLPVVDSHNQLLIRRRIVLDRLDRAISGLLPVLGLSVQDVSSSFRELVFTFRLTSSNVVLKPTQWTLMTIILLSALKEKCPTVKRALESPARAALNLVLGHLGHSVASLGQLVTQTLSQCQERLLTEAD